MSGDHRRILIRHNRSMETGEPSIVETAEYKSRDLLRQAWKISPYNKNNKTFTPRDQVLEEITSEAMCFQPREGFCGMATVNTVLRSLPTPYFIPYPERGRGYSMASLAEYLLLNGCPNPFVDVEAIFMETDTTLEQFQTLLQKQANSSNYRLLANFHRTPLFYSQRGSTDEEAYWKAYAGHWSPVGGVVPTPKGYYVLVLDTNEQYGPFLVSIERFFAAVKTMTLEDGYRGFLKVKIQK